MNNIEQLKQIIENAPEGATHVSSNGVYYRKSENQGLGALVWWRRGEEWIESKVDHLTRSIQDIKTIVEQAEEIERLKREDSKLKLYNTGLLSLIKDYESLVGLDMGLAVQGLIDLNGRTPIDSLKAHDKKVTSKAINDFYNTLKLATHTTMKMDELKQCYVENLK